MTDQWLRFPIYLNGERRFDANPSGDLTVADAYERMDFVFENIEFCFAEGRLMDVEIFRLLDSLGDRIREGDAPAFSQLTGLTSAICSRYGFDAASDSDSIWIRQGESGEKMIWIDRDDFVSESNAELFG